MAEITGESSNLPAFVLTDIGAASAPLAMPGVPIHAAAQPNARLERQATFRILKDSCLERNGRSGGI